MKRRLRTAIFGMGGFARLHHEAMQELELDGTAQLIATCDPDPEKFPALCASLRVRGVLIYRDYCALLDAHRDELDFVTVATPIPLHAEMHRACVERGLAVYLEKPPTLDWRELQAMLEIEEGAHHATQVGFNFIGEPARQNLKSRLLNGEFGEVQRVGFSGFWPRPESYFRRASWAGRLLHGEHLILDSCVGNALAHYVHNLLYWCGANEVMSWGKVEWLEAELYRAHDIESFDTAFARGSCGGIEIRVGATHAGVGPSWQYESLQCESARITYVTRGGGYEILWNDGRHENGVTEELSTGDFLKRNLRHFAAYLQGEVRRPLTTLADSEPFVVLNNLLFVASGQISNVAAPFALRTVAQNGESFLAIADIETLLGRFAREGTLPSEMGCSWAMAGGHAAPAAISRLQNVVVSIIAARPTTAGVSENEEQPTGEAVPHWRAQ